MKIVVAVLMMLASACVVEPPSGARSEEMLSCFGLRPLCGPGMHPVCICGPIGSSCYYVCSR